ncbi:signal sequence receptor alpha subunit [Patellaria atrata CBS 101060]|uniref:Signal recognition particle receptor subunit alpha homolog n=1 Tax=Patellaria atrata CBS 101060 TaxID=1346257 RepID=A0A9P4SBU4_9PEZI|nr:signal sequence receptor alpha subunit [Patellaria atrata CBS 101060]
MIDTFEILSTSGVVLWSKNYIPVGNNVVNSLIREVFIEEKVAPGTNAGEDSDTRKPSYKKEGYTLKWTAAKDLGLIFVAVYQSLVHLTWIDKLLDNVRALFTELYKDELKKPRTSAQMFPFDDYFDRQIHELEPHADATAPKIFEPTPSVDLTPPSSSGTDREGDEPPPMPGLRKAPQKPVYSDNTSTDATPVPTPDTSRPSSPAVSQLLTAKAGPAAKLSRRGRKKANISSAPVSSGDESPARLKAVKKGPTKKSMRRWDDNGMADEDDGTVLDYSAASLDDEAAGTPMEEVDHSTWGKRTGKGEFVLKDLDDEMDSILAAANSKKATSEQTGGIVGSSLGVIGGLFRNVVGGKTLTKEDIAKSMKGMEDHLLKKNVAREAAVRLCESVERELIGMKTASFTSVETTINSAMESALSKILTPATSLDLLRQIQSVTSPSALSLQKPRPYVISIVGVNGVGKSTNLSKLCFFLLQNKYRVLVAAADTFRSGAVEQLKVHVRNLRELSKREGGEVDIYEKGYGKDAANIAQDAVKHATENGFDVVLIDTAGRRHNDARLMSSLEKFAKLANPDKIFMVGEALVGTDSVQQARHFNAAFGAGRSLDGFIISKCDTVGDMVGTLVSMVHATGIPVVFLGTGQHYSDLRTLNVKWAVRLLMS